MTNKEKKEARIKAQELKYRYIATRLIQDLFSAHTITAIEHTPIRCGVDVRFTASTRNGTIITYDIEVKERNKTKEQIIQYPTSELKKPKYESMKAAHINQKLIYIQFINSKWAMIYDIDQLDLEHRKTRNWKIKKTEYDDESEYIVVPTFFIPYKEKIMKFNSEQYFIDYANYQQREQQQ